MASINGNPRPLGSIKDIHRRQYIYFNPDRFTGPDTWRLNLPAEVRCGDQAPGGCVTEHIIKTVAPITHLEQDRDYDLLFTIGACPDLPVSRSTQRRLGVLVIPPAMERAPLHCDIESVTTYEPLFQVESAGHVHFRFNMMPLDPVPTTRSVNAQLSYNTNRVVQTLSAEAPVVADTVGLTTTVSFDVSSLNPLP